MSAIDDGGPAFPHMAADGHADYRRGMSLRDWFAGQALIAIQHYGERTADASLAGEAYRLADAMLAARKVAA